MRMYTRFLHWITGRAERDLDRELRAHLELEEQELSESVPTSVAANESARRAFGNRTRIQEDIREAWGWSGFERCLQDVRYGARQLYRNPGFACVAVLTLALGIGATTAVFSVIHAVLLRELPYHEPSRLVRLYQMLPKAGEIRLGASPPEYLDYRERNRAFDSIAGFTRASFDLTSNGRAERIEAVKISANLPDTLGVAPLLGRTFQADEETPGDDNVALLSHAYWQSRYGGAINAVGATMNLNERSYTIVGIMPPEFGFPATPASVAGPPALWVPLAYTPRQIEDRAASFDTNVVARLAQDVSLPQAQQDVARVASEFQGEHPDIYSGNIHIETILEPLSAEGAEKTQTVLFTLAGAVAFVLLIACSNVANLLLARAATRQREMALRRALGAGSGRLVRQLLTESLLLTLLGGALGCLLARLITGAAAQWGPRQAPGLRAAEVDLTVLVFTLGVSLFTGVLCGLAPVFGWSRSNVGETLKQAGRQAAGLGRRGRRLRSALVIVEAAAAVVLLVCAGLLIRSFVEVLQVPPGFDARGVLVARTSFNRERYPESGRRHQAERAIVERLAALPGVSQVAVTTHLPLADARAIGFALEGAAPGETHWASQALVSDDYFSAMRIPLLRGRSFTEGDTPEVPIATVINETMARSYWPDRDALGTRILWGGRRLVIVGIVGDVRLQALDAEVTPTVYNSVYQVESGATTSAVFVVRSAAADVTLPGTAVREAVQSVDRGLPVFDIRSMNEIVGGSLASRRFTMMLLGSFAAAAMLLAVTGLYAVLSYTVAQRIPELGVRLALGAPPARLVAQVMGQGLRLAAVGVLLGVIVAGLAATAMSSLLFGIGALDAAAFVAAAGVLLAVALAASFVPARRAAKVDPLVALRNE